jgi:hypothetical protein
LKAQVAVPGFASLYGLARCCAHSGCPGWWRWPFSSLAPDLSLDFQILYIWIYIHTGPQTLLVSCSLNQREIARGRPGCPARTCEAGVQTDLISPYLVTTLPASSIPSWSCHTLASWSCCILLTPPSKSTLSWDVFLTVI